jgi:hypothetical protein
LRGAFPFRVDEPKRAPQAGPLNGMNETIRQSE